MKAINIIFIVSFWSLNSLARANCLNFTGSYRLNSQYSEEPIALKIEQKDCERIQLNYFAEEKLTVSELFLLNDQKVKLSEYPDIGLTIYGAPHVKGNDIVIDIENRWKDGKSDFFKRRFHLISTSKTHLLDQRGDFRNDGVFVPSTQTEYIRD